MYTLQTHTHTHTRIHAIHEQSNAIIFRLFLYIAYNQTHAHVLSLIICTKPGIYIHVHRNGYIQNQPRNVCTQPATKSMYITNKWMYTNQEVDIHKPATKWIYTDQNKWMYTNQEVDIYKPTNG